MKQKIIGLLLIVIALFFGYSILSCGTDSYFHFRHNLTCPVSLLTKSSTPVVLNNQIKSIESGTYLVYSTFKIIKTATDFEPAEVLSELYSYRLGDGKVSKLFSSGDFTSFEIYGTKISMTNMTSSSSTQTLVDLNKDKTLIDSFFRPTVSKDGKTEVLVEAKNLSVDDLSCVKDILEIKIIKEGENNSIDKTFIWKDYGLNQLCTENYYVSNNGKYFYVIGDSVGDGSVNTVMKYSVDEDKMSQVNLPAKESHFGSWQLNADNGWLAAVTLGNYLNIPQRIFKLNLISGEITDLADPNSWIIYQVFLSADGNFWVPVFGETVDGELICVRVLPVGEKITDGDSRCLMNGKVIDWVGDMLVVDRGGELVIYDLKTKESTLLERSFGDEFLDEDNQIAEYIGSIKIE
ncbi:MAG: hypothetical protein V1664_03615 [Candidatus Uhrbacteria bacterium]